MDGAPVLLVHDRVLGHHRQQLLQVLHIRVDGSTVNGRDLHRKTLSTCQ